MRVLSAKRAIGHNDLQPEMTFFLYSNKSLPIFQQSFKISSFDSVAMDLEYINRLEDTNFVNRRTLL